MNMSHASRLGAASVSLKKIMILLTLAGTEAYSQLMFNRPPSSIKKVVRV